MAAHHLPAFPDGLETPEAFARRAPQLDDYGALERLLEAAGDSGVVDVPAEDAEAARRGLANRVREGVIAERLWLLGYLDHVGDAEAPAGSVPRGRYLDAVAAFQTDAGLVSDQWAGEITWRALQELVTFEYPTRVAGHIRDGRPGPALVRAVRLRLWALGLLRRRPRGAHAAELPDQNLAAFWTMCRRFGLAGFDHPPPEPAALIEMLFDQDAIVRAVADSTGFVAIGGRERTVFAYRKHRGERRRVTDPEVERFLSCLARIELWLLGFDVRIASARNYPVYRFQDSVSRRNVKVHRAMQQFWALVDKRADTSPDGRVRERRRLERFITPELFRVLADPSLLQEVADAHAGAAGFAPVQVGDYSRQVADALTTQDRIDGAWAAGRRLGMRLWDGLRRLWRWLKRGVRAILDVGANLARGFFRYALKGFEISRRAVAVMASSIGQYLGGEIATGSTVRLFVRRDGDLLAWIPETATVRERRSASLRLHWFATAFRISARILRSLMRALRAAAVPASGWALLLWSLVRSYREMRGLYDQLNRLSAPAALAT